MKTELDLCILVLAHAVNSHLWIVGIYNMEFQHATLIVYIVVVFLCMQNKKTLSKLLGLVFY